MKLELISFKLCPFVQRAVIILKKQNIDYDVTFINIMDPPDWFREISPTGQVPLLKADGEVIFESSVISEFANDIGEVDLQPSDPIQKAKNRAWASFASGLFDDLFHIVTGDEEKFTQAKQGLFKKLELLEAAKTPGNFFNGDAFNLIDAAFAPLFIRLGWINAFTDNALSIEKFEKLSHWANNLLADQAVQDSIDEVLEDMYLGNIESRGAHLSTLLIEE